MRRIFVASILLYAATLHHAVAAELPTTAVAKAKTYLYLREHTGHNDAKEIDRFLAYCGLDNKAQIRRTGTGYSWCAAFALNGYREGAETLNVKQPFPRYARVALLWDACKRNPLKFRAITSDEVRYGSVQLQAGDVPIFAHGTERNGNFDGHTGLVEAQLSAIKIKTIEGNTSSGTSGSQREGDGVFERTRTIAPGTFRIIGFCRAK